jgi:hypothetical protein
MTLLRTGGSKAVSDNAALIGALVALGGVFTAQMVGITLEDQRTREARELEAQRAKEAALQNYLEQVGKLLIEKPLREASPGDNLSTVVRAQTLSALAILDPDRKRILLRFLYESGLINRGEQVVSLKQANLNNANLSGAGLSGSDLSGAYLPGANLANADLNNANLSRAILIGPKSSGDADLTGARLMGADLSNAVVMQDQLNKAASLKGATMPDGSIHE